MANGPFPSVGLYWFDNVDPTIAPGMSAPSKQILIRTDVASVYYKSGPADTDWTLMGAGSGGGTTVTDGVTIQGDGSVGSPVEIKEVITDSTLTGSGTVADPLHAVVPDPNVVSLTFDATVVIGTPLYSSASGHVNKAKADAANTSMLAGFAVAGVSSGASGSVRTIGPITLTTAQWDVLTGDSGGLTFGVYYYIDPSTAGKLTKTPPSTNGQYSAPVGNALSTTIFVINPRASILL